MHIHAEGLMYSVVCGEFTVHVCNHAPGKFWMDISPTGVPSALIVEPIPYDSLIEAFKNADEVIEDLLAEENPDEQHCPDLSGQ